MSLICYYLRVHRLTAIIAMFHHQGLYQMSTTRTSNHPLKQGLKTKKKQPLIGSSTPRNNDYLRLRREGAASHPLHHLFLKCPEAMHSQRHGHIIPKPLELPTGRARAAERCTFVTSQLRKSPRAPTGEQTHPHSKPPCLIGSLRRCCYDSCLGFRVVASKSTRSELGSTSRSSRQKT